MSDEQDDTEHRSEVLWIRWERAAPGAPRVLVIAHDPGAAGLPEQRRIPEGYGLEVLGGMLGLLGLGALLVHRLARTSAAEPVELRLEPGRLVHARGAARREWPTSAIRAFGAGEDGREWRTVFVEADGGRELLLEGLPPADAGRAVEVLRDALREARE
ncbi:MAG: hypothetical protein KF729_27885 [Sandaracinaceae bacterium]|nr:hypothetical protein [Sandaracinaceae bacterium]